MRTPSTNKGIGIPNHAGRDFLRKFYYVPKHHVPQSLFPGHRIFRRLGYTFEVFRHPLMRCLLLVDMHRKLDQHTSITQNLWRPIESGFEDLSCSTGDAMMSSKWFVVTLSKDLCRLISGHAPSYDLISILFE
ncbi:hypothetical protein Tco_1569979 [Tanacetum coccineum]